MGHIRVGALFLVCLATACSDDTSSGSGSDSAMPAVDAATAVDATPRTDATVAPDFQLAASPSMVTVAEGTSGTVTILLTRVGGLSDDVALSLTTMLPYDIQAQLAAATISGATTQTTLTLTVPLDTPPGDLKVNVHAAVACGPHHDASFTLHVTASAMVDVSGKVVDRYDSGMSNVTVILLQNEQEATSVVTGADGSFALPSVPRPYDLYVIESSNQVVIYRGLFARTQTLRLFDAFANAGARETTHLDGTVQGPTYPLASTLDVAVGPSHAPAVDAPGALVDSQNGSYTASSTYAGSPHASSVYALEYGRVPINGSIDPTFRFGKVDGLSLAGGTQSSVDIATQPVTAGMVSATVKPPNTSWSATCGWDFVLGGEARVNANLGDLDTTPTFPAPMDASITTFLIGNADGPGGNVKYWRVAPVPGSITLTVPTGAQPTNPADFGMADHGTVFQWTAVPGAMHVLKLEPETQGPSYFIVTADDKTTVPDLGQARPQFPRGVGYQWLVYGLGTLDRVDRLTVASRAPAAYDCFIDPFFFVPVDGMIFATGAAAVFTVPQ